MRKIGLLALALVLALGALGVGYAAWTDTVTIEGTVNTGTVDLVVEGYSGMWMWKIPGGDPDYKLSTNPAYEPTQVLEYPKPFIVAYSCAAQTTAGATPAPVDDSVTVTFNNLFPLLGADGRATPWEADFECHYVGSIPVKVMIEEIKIEPKTGDDDLSGLTITISAYTMLGESKVWTPITPEELEGLQIHYCDRVRFVVNILVPQYATEALNEPNMGQNGTVTGQIKVIQWNEYEAPGY